MKVVFYASDKPREMMLAQALGDGVRTFGDDFEIRRTAEYGDDLKYEGPTPDTDVACAFGVKGQTKQIITDHCQVGKATLYFDKGYVRDKGEAGHTLYSRVAVNDTDPTAYFQGVPRSSIRWEALKIPLRERMSTDTGHVIFCGSSQKYCDYHNLGDGNLYAGKMLKQIGRVSDRQVVYRPKPSWHDARPVPGTLFSDGSQTFLGVLRGAHCLVTHGSGAAAEAVMAGYPVIVLGNGIARPVASHEISEIDNPKWSRLERRQQWAADLAYCQWTSPELRSGEAWADLRATIERIMPA